MAEFKFTRKNTEGFTQEELNTLNNALGNLRAEYDCEDISEEDLRDAIRHAWEVTVPDTGYLAEAAARWLGLDT